MTTGSPYRTPKLSLSTSAKIPVLGLGVYELDHEDCKRVVSEALRLGYRCIDTAQFYQNEKAVGEAIRESKIPREEIFVTTKVQAGGHTVQGCQNKVEKSLRELDVGYIDLFLIHGPLMGPEKRLNTWKNLTDYARESEGKIRACGVSNFGVKHLEAIAEAGLPTPAVNQIEIHPHLPQTRIVNYCRNHGIVVQAYCPLMRGQSNQASLGQGASWAGVEGMGWDDEGLKRVAKEEGLTIAQVLLKWSVQSGFCPQAKSSSLGRLEENISALQLQSETQTDLNANPSSNSTELDQPLSTESMRLLERMNLEDDPRWEGGGKRIALEWNPVECD